jgi:V/A-type H+-transporting ATPase subunit K
MPGHCQVYICYCHYILLITIYELYILGNIDKKRAKGADNSMVDPNIVKGLIAIGAGIAVAGAGCGAGIAEQAIGAASVGAMAEDEKFFSKGLLMTVIPETIAIFGLVVALILLFIY